jgi:hypothetical protein
MTESRCLLFVLPVFFCGLSSTVGDHEESMREAPRPLHGAQEYGEGLGTGGGSYSQSVLLRAPSRGIEQLADGDESGLQTRQNMRGGGGGGEGFICYEVGHRKHVTKQVLEECAHLQWMGPSGPSTAS